MRRFWLAIFLPLSAWASGWEKGLILRVQQETQVFQAASAKSKVLAEVDPGTLLILRRSSPRALWLEVEDEDGNRAWIAASHTDYGDVRSRKDSLSASAFEAVRKKELYPVDSDKKPVPELKKTKSGFKHEFSFVARRSWVDPSGNASLGGTYTLFFLEDYWNGGKTIARAGLLVGYLDYPKRNSYMIPLRLRYQSQASDSVFYLGPDMGLLWMQDQSRHHHVNLSIGYTLGLLFAKHLTIFLRPAADLFYASRFSIEAGLGLRL
jgi:hypothetical protein